MNPEQLANPPTLLAPSSSLMCVTATILPLRIGLKRMTEMEF